MPGTSEMLRELKRRIGDTMWHNALNLDVSEARMMLDEGIVRKIEKRIGGGGTAIEAANECHLDIPPSDLNRWAAFFRIVADLLAARENASLGTA